VLKEQGIDEESTSYTCLGLVAALYMSDDSRLPQL
jgi:hypothetical protein